MTTTPNPTDVIIMEKAIAEELCKSFSRVILEVTDTKTIEYTQRSYIKYVREKIMPFFNFQIAAERERFIAVMEKVYREFLEHRERCDSWMSAPNPRYCKACSSLGDFQRRVIKILSRHEGESGNPRISDTPDNPKEVH